MAKFTGCDPAVLREVIHSAGLRPKETAKSFVFDCPKCGKKNKLFIRKSDGRFVCWVCKETDSYQGRPEFALADLLGQSVRQVRVRLYGDDGGKADVYLDVRMEDFYGLDDDPDDDVAELPTVDWPCDYYPIEAPESERGAAYLAGRGVPAALAQSYGIRYCPLKRRVVFPVESHGRLYGWQERLVVPEKFVDEEGFEREVPKVLSSKGIPRDRVLMFADRLTGSPHAVVGEGPMDAIKADLCGGNVATMGKAVSRQQMLLILNGGVQAIYLGLDPDAAEETQRLIREYYGGVRLYSLVARIKGAKEKPDLGAMSLPDVRELFLGAEPVRSSQLFVFLRGQ